ncbi:hypothetical protein ACFLVM_01305 [Chloroflexota bacterium]
MSEKKKTGAISGWYSKSTTSNKLTDDEAKRVDEWFDRLIDGNYKRLPVEIPGKMMLTLGKMAKEKDIPFTDFVEGILAEYLGKQGIDWRKS